jgi:hypothetical protein
MDSTSTLPALWDTRIKSPENIIDRIVYQRRSDKKCQVYANIQDEFEVRLERYLRSPGHAVHPKLTGHITEEDIEREEKNTVLRANYFLTAMTGMTSLPQGAVQFEVIFGSHLSSRQLDANPSVSRSSLLTARKTPYCPTRQRRPSPTF